MSDRQSPFGALPPPDAGARAHGARVAAHIRAEIEAAGGALPFARFMERCLYAPGLGYYAAGRQKFGAEGDFVTAPEISPLFSRCVARQVEEILEELGGGDLLELGAGTGAMAVDVLRELERRATLPDRYRILEISAELADRQRRRLAAEIPHLLDRVEWLDALPATPMSGVVLANEVLDALPVQPFRKAAGGPRPLEVGWRGDRFEWRVGAPDPALDRAVAEVEADLAGALPVGFGSEICHPLGPLVATLADGLARGALLFVDYGYRRAELYHPDRDGGTVVCHYRHRVHADPLILAGLQDISASVDFTVVARAGESAGLTVAGYTTQAWFLFGTALEEFMAEGDPDDTVWQLERAQQVKRLTLPGEMGERFKAIALTRGLRRRLRGFALKDFRDRL